jgi:hypothetical protein
MSTERTRFYVKHYIDIGQLLDLHKQVSAAYPNELWIRLQEVFSDWLLAERFGGQQDWKCDDDKDGPSNYFSFWNGRHHNGVNQGSFFEFDLSGASKYELNPQRRKRCVYCYLGFEGRRSPSSITNGRLAASVRAATVKLRNKGYSEFEGHAGCFVQCDVGDLLHISRYNDWASVSRELKGRIEEFVRACAPILDRAAQK